jgi:hypothetical protein
MRRQAKKVKSLKRFRFSGQTGAPRWMGWPPVLDAPAWEHVVMDHPGSEVYHRGMRARKV